ncbi:MAG: SH3 domain-containing protein [bacterium]
MQEESGFHDAQIAVKSTQQGAVYTIILLGKFLKGIYLRTLGAFWHHFKRSTLLGKLFILVSLCAAIGVIFLASKDAIDFSVSNSEFILVTGTRANIRESNTTKTQVIEQVTNGEQLTRKGESEGWWYVEGTDWEKPGWISKDVSTLEKKKVLSVNYQMKGYGIALLASLILMIAGFNLKRA